MKTEMHYRPSISVEEITAHDQPPKLSGRYTQGYNDKRRFSPNKPTYAWSPVVKRQL